MHKEKVCLGQEIAKQDSMEVREEILENANKNFQAAFKRRDFKEVSLAKAMIEFAQKIRKAKVVCKRKTPLRFLNVSLCYRDLWLNIKKNVLATLHKKCWILCSTPLMDELYVKR